LNNVKIGYFVNVSGGTAALPSFGFAVAIS